MYIMKYTGVRSDDSTRSIVGCSGLEIVFPGFKFYRHNFLSKHGISIIMIQNVCIFLALSNVCFLNYFDQYNVISQRWLRRSRAQSVPWRRRTSPTPPHQAARCTNSACFCHWTYYACKMIFLLFKIICNWNWYSCGLFTPSHVLFSTILLQKTIKYWMQVLYPKLNSLHSILVQLLLLKLCIEIGRS